MSCDVPSIKLTVLVLGAPWDERREREFYWPMSYWDESSIFSQAVWSTLSLTLFLTHSEIFKGGGASSRSQWNWKGFLKNRSAQPLLCVYQRRKKCFRWRVKIKKCSRFIWVSSQKRKGKVSRGISKSQAKICWRCYQPSPIKYVSSSWAVRWGGV